MRIFTLTAMVILAISASAQNGTFTFEPLPKDGHEIESFTDMYNKGVAHYNEAVHELVDLDHNMALEDLQLKQEEITERFRAAQPHFEKCYELDDTHYGVLQALAGIYYAIEDDRYDEMMEKLNSVEVYKTDDPDSKSSK